MATPGMDGAPLALGCSGCGGAEEGGGCGGAAAAAISCSADEGADSCSVSGEEDTSRSAPAPKAEPETVPSQ
jgi:hypothetical protein